MPATNVGVTSYRISVSVKDNSSAWLKMAKENVSSALTAMATATLARAVTLAPLSEGLPTDGNLRNSGHIENEGELTRYVIFGDSGVPYARYQEFGGDETRTVVNYTTPGTQAHYLRDAAESVAKEGIKKYL